MSPPRVAFLGGEVLTGVYSLVGFVLALDDNFMACSQGPRAFDLCDIISSPHLFQVLSLIIFKRI